MLDPGEVRRRQKQHLRLQRDPRHPDGHRDVQLRRQTLRLVQIWRLEPGRGQEARQSVRAAIRHRSQGEGRVYFRAPDLDARGHRPPASEQRRHEQLLRGDGRQVVHQHPGDSRSEVRDGRVQEGEGDALRDEPAPALLGKRCHQAVRSDDGRGGAGGRRNEKRDSGGGGS